MSVNITVNGKIAKPCGKYVLLEDSERVKKQREDELRKQRLQEVRNQSRDLARKIRKDVAAEKERQLRRLEIIKAHEVNCWRQHVLAQNNHDYRTAIFQVGAAHCAAQAENELRKATQRPCRNEPPESYLEFRKKLKARRSCKAQEDNLKNRPLAASTERRIFASCCTQTSQRGETNGGTAGVSKRKRCTCSNAHVQCDCCNYHTDQSDHENEFITNGVTEDSQSETLSTLSSFSSDDEVNSTLEKIKSAKTAQSNKQHKVEKKAQKLTTTPAVVLEVADNSDNSLYISPKEVRDNHAESNRQFRRIVDEHSPDRPKSAMRKKSPLKSASGKSPATASPMKKASRKKSLLKKTLRKDAAVKENIIQKSSEKAEPKKPAKVPAKKVTLKRSPVKKMTVKPSVKVTPEKSVPPPIPNSKGDTSKHSTKTSKSKSTPQKLSPVRKRFSNISDLIQKQRTAREREEQPTESAAPKSPRPTSPSTATKTKSPRKKVASANETGRTDQIKTADSESAQKSVSATTFVLGDGTSERVQFYDYNNKFSKDYPQPVQSVRIHKRQEIEPTAMQEAAVEKGLQGAREKEKTEQRMRSEERGQTAILREQVRRDCIALTEKLEALTRDCQQVIPSDAHLVHSNRHATMTARKEAKMNVAVEEILTRPAIITCPEVDKQQMDHQPGSSRAGAAQPIVPNEINLATTTANMHENISPRTDSCCSLLLGYVNDQSQQIRNEINQFDEQGSNQDTNRITRLVNLLKRIEQMREVLMKELQNNEVNAVNEQQMEQMIDSISNLRREREHIVIDDFDSEHASRATNIKQKETILERKLREFCEKEVGKGTSKKKTTTQTSNEVRVVRSKAADKPIEIVIKVQSETAVNKQRTDTAKESHKSAKQPNQSMPLEVVEHSPNIIVRVTDQEHDQTDGQNSYNSNSTSYRSLPPKISNNMDALVDRIANPQRGDHETPTTSRPGQQRHHRLNPVVAQYVQRLLGMTRDSVRMLQISSSDLETPPGSVICVPSNMSVDSDNNVPTQERLDRVQKFIEENRSFIGELEASLRTQNDSSLEENMRSFDKIWKQRLRKKNENANDNQDGETAESKKKAPKRIPKVPGPTAAAHKHPEKSTSRANASKAKDSMPGRRITELAKPRHGREPPPPKTQPAARAPLPARSSQPRGAVAPQTRSASPAKVAPSTKPLKPTMPINTTQPKQTAQSVNARRNGKPPPASANPAKPHAIRSQPAKVTELKVANESTEHQMVRYEQLTENCTQRIAELTELIQRVRVEKRRLVEVTLSSISDTGRNSTDYMDLPDGRQSAEHTSMVETLEEESDAISSSSSQLIDSKLVNELQTSSCEALPENAPLEKDKHTGRSHDSGISMSRPVTSQDQHQDIDPPSNASSSQVRNHDQRKSAKPPPTILRFSPQLVEEEYAHELSTILEVDTPATSRVLPSSSLPNSARTIAESESRSHRNPVTFPTFEEYVQQIDLDISHLDPEQTMRMEQEFNDLMNAIKSQQINEAFNYEHFPTLSAYIQNLTANDKDISDKCMPKDNSPETIEDMLACLRLANLTIQAFPTHKEYMKKLTTNTPEEEFIDSESLERLSDQTTDDTDTINIEEELKRRNILKRSFRSETRRENILLSTEQASGLLTKIIAAENEQYWTSSSSGALEHELQQLGINWPAAMQKKKKATEAMSSSTTSNSRANELRDSSPTQINETKRHENSEVDKPLDLREFLTKELLKHASSSSSCSNDSLRSQFFNSIIDSLSPKSSPHKSNSRNRSRKRTSTPVQQAHSTSTSSHSGSYPASSTATTQLFSGESRLSSVRYHSPPLLYAEDHYEAQYVKQTQQQ